MKVYAPPTADRRIIPCGKGAGGAESRNAAQNQRRDRSEQRRM